MRALFRRHPFRTPSDAHPPVPADLDVTMPGLRARIDTAADIIEPAFIEADERALRTQTRFRRVRVALLCTAAITTIAGAVQAVSASTGVESVAPGVVIAVSGFAAAWFARGETRDRPGENYLVARAQAEQLRSLHFRYLSGELGDDPELVERRVVAIVHPLERTDG